MSSGLGWRGSAAVGLAVAKRPRLWRTAVRQWRRTTPAGWWRRPPFVPLPARDYLHFRVVTQYGDVNARVAPDDVLNYLTWCHRQQRAEAASSYGR